jgi:hypothetical protein
MALKTCSGVYLLTKEFTELLFHVQSNNKKARKLYEKNKEDAQKYHDACKKALLEIINGNYYGISKTCTVMYDKGNGIGCEECVDTGAYTDAVLRRKKDKINEIEKKYGIKSECEGCSSCLMM